MCVHTHCEKYVRLDIVIVLAATFIRFSLKIHTVENPSLTHTRQTTNNHNCTDNNSLFVSLSLSLYHSPSHSFFAATVSCGTLSFHFIFFPFVPFSCLFFLLLFVTDNKPYVLHICMGKGECGLKIRLGKKKIFM